MRTLILILCCCVYTGGSKTPKAAEAQSINIIRCRGAHRL